ncbi:MAG: succinylglutamate desuccinylase/aspartoacylase family protein [Bacteroidota bacterium]
MPEPFSTPRIIGHYQGAETGPLVIAIGGIHGNEPAGISALERLFDLLAEEPQINPGFTFRGELLALRGNLSAIARGQRYIDQDLNRIWQDHHIARLQKETSVSHTSEERELLQLLAAIEVAIEETRPTEIVVIDLHTTTATGGIFTITGDDIPSLELGAELYAPVIKGMLNGLMGTTLHYFRGLRFGEGIHLRSLTFEAGQHNDPLSIDRALAAVINLLRGLGCVQDADVRTLHDELLQTFSANLPRLTELAYVHKIRPEDNFKMATDFQNFQPVQENQQLGEDRNGPVYAPCSGYVLMPLYQEKGEEGFSCTGWKF